MEMNEGETKPIPVCKCKAGLMKLLEATVSPKNLGRMYYICPNGTKHKEWFFWCDEYHKHDMKKPDYVVNQKWIRVVGPSISEASSSGVRGSRYLDSEGVNGVANAGTNRHIRSDGELQIAIAFMVFVGTLLGFIIGKITS